MRGAVAVIAVCALVGCGESTVPPVAPSLIDEPERFPTLADFTGQWEVVEDLDDFEYRAADIAAAGETAVNVKADPRRLLGGLRDRGDAGVRVRASGGLARFPVQDGGVPPVPRRGAADGPGASPLHRRQWPGGATHDRPHATGRGLTRTRGCGTSAP